MSPGWVESGDFRALVERNRSQPEWLLVLDGDGRPRASNGGDGAVPSAELVGRLPTWFAAADRRRAERALRRALGGNRARFHGLFSRGAAGWVEVRLRPVRLEGRHVVVARVEPIARLPARPQFETRFAHLAQCVILVDPLSARVVAANPMAQAQFGLDPAATLAFDVGRIFEGGPWARGGATALALAVHEAGRSIAGRARTEALGEIALEARLEGDAHDPLLLLVARSQLFRQPTPAPSMGGLAARPEVIAQELGSPLGQVLASLEHVESLLMASDDAANRAEITTTVRSAILSARRACAVLAERTGLASAVAKKVSPSPRLPSEVSFDLAKAAQIHGKLFSSRSGVEVRVESTGLCSVSGDPVRMGEAITEVLGWASSGGGFGMPIVAHVYREGARAVIDVRPDSSDRAGEALRRFAQPVIRRRHDDDPLGLCQRIARERGGSLDIDPLGRRLIWSMAATEAVTLAKRGRVLVVDDDPECARAMARILGRHEVTVALSGQAGLDALLSTSAFDVVLCDLIMPGLSGIDLYEALKQRRPELSERLIFVTGGASTPRARDFLSAVDNKHIAKPFAIREVRQAVAASIAAP